MYHGLQVRMSADELKARLSERIRVRSAKADALDERIKRREGDQPYDVRPDDGLESLGELVKDRDRHRQRISELTLFRDRLAAEDVVVLTMEDLQAADLLHRSSHRERRARSDGWGRLSARPVEGLKLTMSGCELHAMLGERIADHEESAAGWRREAARTPEEQTEDEPLLPEEMCLTQAERHEWRVRVLRFIREHLDPTDMFRLGPDDLAFGELLPARPDSVAQADYEERSSIGFSRE
jgi:hypothetical protein